MGNSHDAEFEIRKQAIKNFLHGSLTQKEIYEQLNKSRYWFEYWYNQYRSKGLKGLYSKSAGYPKGRPRRYPSRLINEIVAIRKHLEEDPEEYYYGAERIAQELIALGYTKDKIPSLAYIKKVLSQQGCVKETRLKNYTPLRGYPEFFLTALGLLCQMDFIGYKRIHHSNNPIHFLALAYRELKYGHIWRIRAEKSSIIIPLLFEFWQHNPKPDVVQMDNDWAFHGSGSALGTISHTMRFLLALGITPLFIPESSPWRNAEVEGIASLFSRKFWQKHDFKSLAHIDKELVIYNKKTREYTLKKLNIDPSSYDTISKTRSFSKRLVRNYKFKNTDVIYFIRLGRLYNRHNAVKILNYKITVPEEFLNHYVLIKLHIVSGTAFLYQEIDNKQLVEIKKSKIKLKP
jgi:hypothetical protein